MKKSLKALLFFAFMFYLLAVCFLPFANPWFFLLSIPAIMMIPHMSKIDNYLTDWMND